LELADGGRSGLLSIGVFLVVVVVSILLYQPLQVLLDWTLILPLVLALFGCWTVILAGMRASNPQKYVRSAFSTLSGGLLLLAIGGAWLLFGLGFGWVYSLVTILVVLAVLAIAAALKRK
jgi:uncharacterized membrane protein